MSSRPRQPGADWLFREVAEHLRISNDKVYRYVYQGHLIAYNASDTPGVHRWKVTDANFEEFLAWYREKGNI